MTPYLLLLLFVTAIAYASRRSGNPLIRRASLVLVGAVLIAFAGLRDFTVGTDTGVYVRWFFESDSIEILWRGREIGYNALSWIARALSDSYVILLFLTALMVVPLYVYTIVRLVHRYEIGIFLFIALGVYTFFFNGARQGIAAAICFAAVPFLLERKPWRYFSAVLLASIFHVTALVALPLYQLAGPAVNWKRVAWVGLAIAGAVMFLQGFVNIAALLLDDRFAVYGEAGEGGGEVLASFLVAQGAALYLFKSRLHDPHRVYSRLLNLYLLGLIPVSASVLTSVNPSGLLRLHLYFSPMAILLWPMVMKSFRSIPMLGLFAVGFFTLMLTYFVVTTSTFSKLVPYIPNAEIF